LEDNAIYHSSWKNTQVINIMNWKILFRPYQLLLEYEYIWKKLQKAFSEHINVQETTSLKLQSKSAVLFDSEINSCGIISYSVIGLKTCILVSQVDTLHTYIQSKGK
jgi:hypothetical protein